MPIKLIIQVVIRAAMFVVSLIYAAIALVLGGGSSSSSLAGTIVVLLAIAVAVAAVFMLRHKNIVPFLIQVILALAIHIVIINVTTDTNQANLVTAMYIAVHSTLYLLHHWAKRPPSRRHSRHAH